MSQMRLLRRATARCAVTPRTVDPSDIQIISHTFQGNAFLLDRTVSAHDPYRLIRHLDRSGYATQWRANPKAWHQFVFNSPERALPYISPLHNIAAAPLSDPTLVHFVNEIPLGQAGKLECDIYAPGNPIVLRERPAGVQNAGSPYFLQANTFQIPVNYGFIPQTFHSSNRGAGIGDFVGDGRPLDAVLYTRLPVDSGAVVTAKVAGVYALHAPGSAKLDCKILLIRPDEFVGSTVAGWAGGAVGRHEAKADRLIVDDVVHRIATWFQESDHRIEGRKPRTAVVFPDVESGEIVEREVQPTWREAILEQDAHTNKHNWRAKQRAKPNLLGPVEVARGVIAAARAGYADLLAGRAGEDGEKVWLPKRAE